VPLPTASVIKWLVSLGWDVTEETGAPVKPGPYVPEMPDRLVVITSTPGPGFQLEAAADAQVFQARVRGPQMDQDAAEELAFSLDGLILGASFPAVVDGRTIIHCHRFGGAPAPLTGTPDSGDRYELVCSYLLTASTT
jgi:hypothetical protein